MNSFLFSHFHEHIFRSSRSQMLFKVAALKNFAIFRMKKGLQQRCFLSILLFFPQQLFYRAPPVAASAFIKSNWTAILQRCLKKCPYYDVLIFSSQHVLDTCLMYKKSNSFVYNSTFTRDPKWTQTGLSFTSR